MTDAPWVVLFTANASTQAETVDAWWRSERRDASALFLDELSAAVKRLTGYPGTGASFRSAAVPGLRRILLPRCRYHLYDTVHPPRHEVIVRAVWHASRGQGPELV